jgi:GNAT superfamily N-acetyltransferase
MADPDVRRAGPDDAPDAARLLDAFNVEFGEPTPGPQALATRVAELVGAGEAEVLLSGDGSDGVLVLRLRPSLWAAALDAYVEELYVRPAVRRLGHGRALLGAALDIAREAGAVRIELFTGRQDRPARALYESFGFVHDDDIYYAREL